MGDGDKTPLRLQFNPKVRLEFHGATITSDAGLLPIRELDDALGLTHIAADYLQESRSGRNIRHHLVPLLRQSIYSRLAGYDDTNDAERLSQDPAMRVVVGWQGSDRNAASTNTVSRFETETLTQQDNLQGLARMNPQLDSLLSVLGSSRVIPLGCAIHRRDFLGVNGGGMLGHWGGVKLYHLVCSCSAKKPELTGQHKCPHHLLREMACLRVGQQRTGRKVLMLPILREACLEFGRQLPLCYA